MLVAFLVLVAYAIGTFPTAQIVGRRLGVDPTREGSGNPGASNVYRLGGRRAGVVVGLIDMAKGAVPTAIAPAATGRPGAHAVWVAAVLGHGVADHPGLSRREGCGHRRRRRSGAQPAVGLACAGVFLLTVKVARVAALGSLGIAVTYPVLSLLAGAPGWEVAVSATIAAILVVRHQSNIRRLYATPSRCWGRAESPS
ncbi:MAG: glycerol-3-phosphate acyltransferase [Acidimicrobiales bacterium]